MDKETLDSLLLAKEIGGNSRRTNLCLDHIVQLNLTLGQLREDLARAEGGGRVNKLFRDILVTVEPELDAHELLDCMAELEAIHERIGDDHQYTVFAQVFGHQHSKAKYYMTGKILTPDQTHRIRAILAEPAAKEAQ